MKQVTTQVFRLKTEDRRPRTKSRQPIYLISYWSSMNPMPVSTQGSRLPYANWRTGRLRARSVIRRLKSEGWRSEFEVSNTSVFSLLHPSRYSRQSRFIICPQCPISAWFLSRKLDSVTHCVYSYGS